MSVTDGQKVEVINKDVTSENLMETLAVAFNAEIDKIKKEIESVQ